MGLILLCFLCTVFGFFIGKNIKALIVALGYKHKAYVPVKAEKMSFTTSHPWDELD